MARKAMPSVTRKVWLLSMGTSSVGATRPLPPGMIQAGKEDIPKYSHSLWRSP